MSSIAAARLLLFADAPRAIAPKGRSRIRRYRLARLPLEAARHDGDEPRYAHLKRSYD